MPNSNISRYFFFKKIRLEISCQSSVVMIPMKCHELFSQKNKRNIINLLSANFVIITEKLMLTFNTLLVNSVEDKWMIFFLPFPRKQNLTFHANCQFT